MDQPDPAVLLAQRLAGNEKKIRDRAVRKLRRYLRVRSAAESGGFTEDEFTKIWKGLFYCMWMQDKPLLQEQLANTTSQLIYALHTRQSQQLFIKTFWQTLSREWNGIDRLRLDKFYTLARLVLRRSVELLRKAEWEESHVGEFLAMLTQEVLLGGARGVQFHLIDIYLDELAQVGAAELPADLNIKLIEPFCTMAAKSKDMLLLQAVLTGIFQVILDQAPFAIEDLMKELKETSGDSDSDSPESAETMRQDAEDVGPVLQMMQCAINTLHHIFYTTTSVGHQKFDYVALADRLFTLASKTYTPAHNRKRLYRLVKQFRDLAEGDFPQDDFPEEVSTDEDDDEFSSWRFRKRQKRIQAREAQMSNPVESMNEEQKGQKRKKEDSAISAGAPDPPDSVSPAPAKKKLKKKGAEINSSEETSPPAVNGEMIESLKIPDPEPEFSSPPSSALKIKMKKRRRASLLRQRMGFTSPEQEVVAGVSETPIKAGDAALKAGDAARTALKAGDAARTALKAGEAARTALKAGDAARTALKAGDTARAALKAGDAARTALKAGDAARTALKAGDTARAALKAGDAARTALKAGDAARAALKAGDAARAALKAGDAARAALKAGDAARAALKAGDAARAALKAGDAARAALKAGDAALKAGDIPKAALKAGDVPKSQKKATKIQAKVASGHQEFVSFCESETPKPVFVKTTKRKGGQVHTKCNINSKKVTFSLNQNMTAEFKRTDRSLLVSPTGSFRVPFNPEQKPQHGVLKTPVKSTRPRAADFF